MLKTFNDIQTCLSVVLLALWFKSAQVKAHGQEDSEILRVKAWSFRLIWNDGHRESVFDCLYETRRYQRDAQRVTRLNKSRSTWIYRVSWSDAGKLIRTQFQQGCTKLWHEVWHESFCWRLQQHFGCWCQEF